MRNFIQHFNHAGIAFYACMATYLLCTNCNKKETSTVVLNCFNESKLSIADNMIVDTIELPNNPFDEYVNIYPEKYLYWSPDFNPNNQNQICFIRQIGNQQASYPMELCTYDFCSGQLRVIANNIYYHPRWGKKGWIVFTGNNWQLWKVKPNGDSLMQIKLPFSNQAVNSHAEWDTTGSYFVFQNSNNPAYLLYLSDLEGNLIDSFNIEAPPKRWRLLSSKDLYVVVGSDFGAASLLYINKHQNQRILIATKEATITGNSNYSRSNWNFVSIGHNELFLAEPFGVWSVQSATGQISQIIKGADNRNYSEMQVDRNSKHLLLHRYDLNQKGDTIVYRSNIHLYNLKAKQEYKLDLNL